MSLRNRIVQAVVVPLVDTWRRNASSRRALCLEARNAVSEGESIAMANWFPYNLYIPRDVTFSVIWKSILPSRLAPPANTHMPNATHSNSLPGSTPAKCVYEAKWFPDKAEPLEIFGLKF